MLEIIETLILTLLLMHVPSEGSLSRYDPGVMERVLDWRHKHGIPAGFDPYGRNYDGYIAVADCDRVGDTAVLDLYISGEYMGQKTVLISDCAGAPETVQWMIDHRIVAEIGWQGWTDWGIEDGAGAWIILNP